MSDQSLGMERGYLGRRTYATIMLSSGDVRMLAARLYYGRGLRSQATSTLLRRCRVWVLTSSVRFLLFQITEHELGLIGGDR